MNKIALTAAAAMLLATGSAFARPVGDHNGTYDNIPGVTHSYSAPADHAGNLDRVITGSINKLDSGNKAVDQTATPDEGQGIWGR